LVALFLYQNQANTASESFESVTSEAASFNSDLRILSFYGVDYTMQGQENRRIVDAISYGCAYGGSGEDKLDHTVSGPDNTIFLPNIYTEDYLNQTISDDRYYLEMDCDPSEEDSKKLEVGEKPPNDAEIVARSIPVPLPYENKTKLRLLRWY